MSQPGKPAKGPGKPANSILDAYPGARRRSTPQPAEEPASSKGTIIKLSAAVLVMIVAGVVAVYTLKAMSGSKAQSGPPMVGNDAAIFEKMEDTGVQDLEEWLNGYQGRMVMGMTRPQAFDTAKFLKKGGAKNVFAFKASMMTMSFVVELPDEPEKRAPLLQWYLSKTGDRKGSADIGQRYLQVMVGP